VVKVVIKVKKDDLDCLFWVVIVAIWITFLLSAAPERIIPWLLQ